MKQQRNKENKLFRTLIWRLLWKTTLWNLNLKCVILYLLRCLNFSKLIHWNLFWIDNLYTRHTPPPHTHTNRFTFTWVLSMWMWLDIFFFICHTIGTNMEWFGWYMCNCVFLFSWIFLGSIFFFKQLFQFYWLDSNET